MTREEKISFLSADGKTRISARKWSPADGKYRGVVQLVHGMVEYIDRYRPFAEFLNDNGFLVVGHDHLGHGDSVRTTGDWGYIAEGRHPEDVLVQDIHKLRKKIQRENEGLPYFILGHSMGSYMLRKYLCYHSLGLTGVILMGTGYVSPIRMHYGRAVCSCYALVHGWHYYSQLVWRRSFGRQYRKYDVTGMDAANSWLSKNVEDVKKYYSEPRSSFRFTVNGYYALMGAVAFDCRMSNVRKVLCKIPLLFVSGKEDPVGNCGAGVIRVARMYRRAGFSDVKCRLYEEDRHEILNEPDREKVYQDILQWLRLRMEQ